MSELPQFLREMLDNPPTEDRHGWLFRVSRQLHAHMRKQEIFDHLRARTDGGRLGRHVPDSEIVDAINSAEGCAWRPSGTSVSARPKLPRWPAPDVDKRQAVIEAQGLEVADLWEQSPIRLDESGPDAEDIIDRLFPPDSLLCVGKSSTVFATRKREAFRERLGGLPLMVPNIMRARLGKRKKDGSLSEHTLDNTGPRRFLICEFDSGSVDDHASLLSELSNHMPLVLAVFSGSKSLHGWFYVDGLDEKKCGRFFREACRLGADPRLWSRCQFCRIPFGTRENGARQLVHYFNPKPVIGFP